MSDFDCNFNEQCMLHNRTFVSKNFHGDGFNMQGFSPSSSSEVCQLFVSSNFSRFFSLHRKGLYGNLRDLAVSRFVGIPFFHYDKNVCVNHQVIDESCLTHSHQYVHVNKLNLPLLWLLILTHHSI